MKINRNLSGRLLQDIRDSLSAGVSPDDVLLTLTETLNDFVSEMEDVREEYKEKGSLF